MRSNVAIRQGTTVSTNPADLLRGGALLPSMIEIGDAQVHRDRVVARAFADSGLTAVEWNLLDAERREHALADAIDSMRAESAKRLQV
jgi:hypothetical protein